MKNEEQSENLSGSRASDSGETASSQQSAGTAEEEGGISAAASDDASEEVSKLRQGIARRDGALIREAQRRSKLESQLAEIDPYARIGLALAKAPGGEVIIEKLRRGEALTAGETRKVEAAAAAGGNGASAPALDSQQLQTLIAQTVSSLLDQRDLSQRQLTKLVGRAEKELAGFTELKESPAYLGAVDAVRVAVENGSLAVPEAEDVDRHYFIMRTAYNMMLAANPEIVKARAEVEEAQRSERAEKKALAGSLETTRTRTETGKFSREQEENVKLLQRWSTGRRFAGPRSASR